MNKEESLALYEKGVEAWNIWANDMLAKKEELVLSNLWQINHVTQGANQATKDWMDNSSVSFTRHSFNENVNFSHFIFPYSVHFNGVVFSRLADFNDVTFSHNASFGKAIFSGDARFNSVTFSDNALFCYIKFSGNVQFGGAKFNSRATFRESTFNGNALFGSAKFSDEVSFSDAKFGIYTSFRGSIFIGNAWFDNAIFSNEVYFENASFSGNARFTRTLFEGFTSFNETSFENRSSFIAIKGQSYFSFKDATFHLVPDFTQAHFIEAPQFDDSDFSKALNHKQSKRGDNLSSYWRSLKRLAIQGHDHERELIFFAEEIKSQRGIQDKALPNPLNYLSNKLVWQGGTRYWFGYLYQYLSDFGRSVMRPLLWLLILGVLFYIFYLKYPIEDNPTLTHDDPITQLTISCERSEAAIYLSARSALPFLPANSYSEKTNRSYECLYGKNSEGKANKPNVAVFFSIAQTILSTILIFLSLLALRNHFRIK